ncbi:MULTISPECIES: MarR family winged helix-turn-helix transcriptional regulator [unclassified Lactococcus]|uniref:MarR family winged helix-turn-helix transcriptional regulator n=1 Tax=unclassified Lactococcus TaxID=2643510 RepID=UPI0011C9656D|nr:MULTISPECIES: MarR family transcriptional regulator [unclassified Lactococcus]MQW22184.1 MarR family transcriptional regulator [Lactococcus sp. dk101]TXK45118.1 MarR family transcriptional regulator [Lactococcus sp. dk310]TXK51102.1 MarR family transcriptional regulator [Lactococcus sp. dk322]
MSEKTNELLHLFSQLLHSPRFMMAMHMEMMYTKLQSRGNRNGASGLMVELWKQDGLTNAEIAELLDIKPSSVTAQVKNLEEEGYVERRQDEKDKRVNRVYLTESGRKVYEKRADFKESIGIEVFDGLSQTEKETLADLLSKLNALNADSELEDMMAFGPGGFPFPPHEFHPDHRDIHRMRNEIRQQMRGQDWNRMRKHRFFSEGKDGEFNPFDCSPFGPMPANRNADKDKKKAEADEWNDF